jgi:hypothetical protein
MQTEAMERISNLGVWTGGKANKEQALSFWGQVFAWPKMDGKVIKASTPAEQLGRLGLVREFLAGLSYDQRGAAAKRLYLDRSTYRKYKKEAERFYGLLQGEAQKKRLFWWVVVAPTGHKGFGWGPEVPKGDHIIYGDQKKTPQPQVQPTEREEENTPHYPPNSDEPPL